MLRVSILGAGSIARTMAKTLRGMEERDGSACLWGIASRDGEKARAFAEAEGAKKHFAGYDALLQDPDTDLIYIATPHAFHGKQIEMCVQAGKAVLCEKAFTGNAKQAEAALAASEAAGVLVTEAIWTRYQPARAMIRELIDTGEIGEVRHLSCNLGYPIMFKQRIVKPELAGGALLDLGVYCLNFAAMVLGTEVARTESSCTRLPGGGVDISDHITLYYQNGCEAELFATALCRTNRRGLIYGTDGWIQVDNINNPQRITVFDNDGGKRRKLNVPEQITGYEYEVEACARALESRACECPEMPHAETLRLMRQMDELRARWGVVYPFD